MCSKCGGAGETVASVCEVCGGAGTKREAEHGVDVTIEPNAAAGRRARFAKAGDDVFAGRGDLVGRRDVVVLIEEEPHPDLQRLGKDLLCARRVPLLDALTGFRVAVPTVARDDVRGKTLDVVANPGGDQTSSRRVFFVRRVWF